MVMFDYHYLRRNGRLCGYVMVSGPEIHVHIYTDHQNRHVFRKELKEYLGWIIEQYGYAVTSVRHEGNHEFVKRLGFKETHFDMFNCYYRIEEMRHVRT